MSNPRGGSLALEREKTYKNQQNIAKNQKNNFYQKLLKFVTLKS